MEVADFPNLARDVLSVLTKQSIKTRASVIALHGPLGAGKTTFTQALSKELGITEVVQSPTYVLMKSYSIHFKNFRKFLHIDGYRFEKPEEFETLKPAQFLNKTDVLICIEWPERLGNKLKNTDIELFFEYTADKEKRNVFYKT